VRNTIQNYPIPNYEETLQQEWQGSGIGFGSQGGATWVTVATVERKSYLLNGQVMAIRVTTDPAAPEDGLYYPLYDHLGSTSLLTDESGEQAGGTIRYYPYGRYRVAPTTGDITDRGFTGHKHNNYIKLVDMKARWYDQAIGRFISPDTIVPDPANPQSFNRFSYVNNNPIRFVDPSGRCLIESHESSSECTHSPPPQPPQGTHLYVFQASIFLQKLLGDAGIRRQTFSIRVHIDNDPHNPELYHYEIGAWILTQEHDSFHPLYHVGDPANADHFADIGLYTALVLLQVIDSREANNPNGPADLYRWVQENPNSGQIAYPPSAGMEAPSDSVYADFLILAILNDQGVLPDTLSVYADFPTQENPSGRPYFYGHYDLVPGVGANMGRESLSVSSHYWRETDWVPSLTDWLTVTEQ
jgi:RHS repeat-associated protein